MTEEQDEHEDEVTMNEKQLIKAAVATLMRHFDFVQIIAGSDVAGETNLIAYGDGNMLARIGQAHVWLTAMSNSHGPNPEDDFE